MTLRGESNRLVPKDESLKCSKHTISPQTCCHQSPKLHLERYALTQAKFYNVPTSIWKWQHRRLSINEDHGVTLKHKCGKRIVTLSLLSFSLIFLFGPSFFPLWPLFSFFRSKSHPDLWGNHNLHHPFLTWDNPLIMMIITLLLTYNSRITTQYLEKQYDSMWMPPAEYRDMQWI